MFIVDNLEATGTIGGYVSISIIGFAIFNCFLIKKRNKLAAEIGPKWTHPIIGSFLGAIPGCGATIVVASLYKNKKISFGGLFAAFISTLGEGSFVLLGASNESDVAANLKAYAIITIFGFIAGILFGFLCDILNFTGSISNKDQNNFKYKENVKKSNNDEINQKDHVLQIIGFYVIMLMVIFLAPGSVMAFWGGGIEVISELTLYVSIALTISCILYYFMNEFIIKSNNCHCEEDNFKSTMLHAVKDVSMVVTYVFIGLLIANYIIDIIVGPEIFEEWMKSSDYILILLAAVIGFIPGCGGMITVAAAYITINNFPIAALIAAAVATSGDGIFPLFAQNKKDGLIVSLFGLVVALIVGYLALVLGLN